MEEVKVRKVRLEDGRYGEIQTREQSDCTGEAEIVHEHYEEEPRQLHLKRRITEKRKPVVYERTVESIEGNEVVERKVESLEPECKMQLREHLGLAKMQAQSNDDPCYATCQDIKEAMLAVAEAVRDSAAPAPKMRMRAQAQDAVENSVQESGKWGWVEFVLLATIGVESAWLVVHIAQRFLAS